MDRETRRNSILKPVVINQSLATAFEYEEEQTETLTSSRRKSFKKRVSFAGRDEIKEFQKHEVLTLEKLEKALNKLQDETLYSNIDASGWDCEKENLLQQTGQKIEILNQCDDMEITSTITVAVNQSDSMVQDIEMEVSSGSLIPICNVVGVDCVIQEESTTSTRMAVIEDSLAYVKDPRIQNSIQEMEILTNQKDVSCPSVSEKFIQLIEEPSNEFSRVKIIEDSNLHCSSVVSEVKTAEATNTCNEMTTLISDSTQKKLICVKEFADEMKESEVNYPDFVAEELSEIIMLSSNLGWKIELFESVLVLSKIKNYLVLKFKLDRQYHYQKVKHYAIEEIEIDTQKDVEEKWTRLGLIILENSLENSNLKEVCSSTQDLPKLLHIVEEYTRIFLDFATEDSLKFELLANPRSIKFDTDYSKVNVTFELSNLENLFWVRIFLNLTSAFPLSAKDIRVESILGTMNKTELTNMITNIRPSSLYLTRIAECISDFLKFHPTNNERKISYRARE